MADPLFNLNDNTFEPLSPKTDAVPATFGQRVPTSSRPSTTDGYRESVGMSDLGGKDITTPAGQETRMPIGQGISPRTSFESLVSSPTSPATSLQTPFSQTPGSVSETSPQEVHTHSAPTSEAPDPLNTSSIHSESGPVIPDTSVAVELRKHQDRSPIERGPAPRLEVIQEGLEREKNLVHPEETVKKTLPGDPLFAPNIIKAQEKSSEETAGDTARAEAAKQRGLEKAEEAGKKQPIKSLRTFQSDVAEAMSGNKPSMLQVALSEHHAKEDAEEENISVKKKNLSFLVGAIALITTGVGVLGLGGWYWYTDILHNDSSQKTDVAIPSFFSTESKKEISINDLDRAGLLTSIRHELAGADFFVDSISQVYLTELTPSTAGDANSVKTVISTQQFLSLTGSTMPSWLARSLDPAFMLGVHVWNGNQPFLVYSTSSDLFDNTFSAMLKWEPSIAQDILPLFGSKVREDIYTRAWEDVVLKNRDVRALKDTSGNIVLLYTFYDRKTLIITTSPDTMDEIIQRIIQTKRQ